MPYKPIESYGVIGDLHSVALVGTDGAIDWCCLPNFDSPSIFAAILDDQKGGFFRLCADHPGSRKQMYLPETNVLLTRFLSSESVGEVVDFMPVADLVEHRDQSAFTAEMGSNGASKLRGGRRPCIQTPRLLRLRLKS